MPMRPGEMAKEMADLQGTGKCHQCAPRAWRDVPNLTGDFDFDATILHRHNKDLPNRLQLYVKQGNGGYGPGSAYKGYANYSKDS